MSPNFGPYSCPLGALYCKSDSATKTRQPHKPRGQAKTSNSGFESCWTDAAILHSDLGIPNHCNLISEGDPIADRERDPQQGGQNGQGDQRDQQKGGGNNSKVANKAARGVASKVEVSRAVDRKAIFADG